MKRLLLVSTPLVLSLINQIAYADMAFTSSDPNTCEHIEGDWAGKVTAKNWMANCEYLGTGTVVNTDNAGNFSVNLNGNLKPGSSSACPNNANETLKGVCTNGYAKITTDYGDLNGSFNETKGEAKGTLNIMAGVSVDVKMSFERLP